MYKFHEIANIFPLMPDAELKNLANDIEQNGLKQRIILYEGKILDGRNRYNACNMINLIPLFEKFTGDDPLKYVISLNLHRRHLNESQRAVVAARIANMEVGDNQYKSGSANLPIQNISQSQAAEMLNISERSLRDAKTILKENPEAIHDIELGDKTIHEVNKERKIEQRNQKIEEEKQKKQEADNIDSIIVETKHDVKLGDIIKLGNHILYCGDAYNIDIKADAIITDPPYGIDYEPDWKKWDGTGSDFKKIIGDNKTFDPSPFMKYKTMLFFGANYYTDNLPIGCWLVWDKRIDEIKDRMIGNPFELAWFISQHTSKKAIIKRILHGGVVNADSIKGNNEKRYHPTQKPIILIQSIIEEITLKNEIVFDPFAGSGSTLLACELSDRNCRSIEIEPEYCSIIISRWEEATNKKAIWMQE